MDLRCSYGVSAGVIEGTQFQGGINLRLKKCIQRLFLTGLSVEFSIGGPENPVCGRIINSLRVCVNAVLPSRNVPDRGAETIVEEFK